MTSFRAGVQYGDWKGTSAADNADRNDLSDYLTQKGLLRQNEFLIATELWVGENRDGNVAEPSITAFIYAQSGYENVAEALARTEGPIPVRKLDLEMTLDEYLSKFKRFAVVTGRRGLDLTDREYIET